MFPVLMCRSSKGRGAAAADAEMEKCASIPFACRGDARATTASETSVHFDMAESPIQSVRGTGEDGRRGSPIRRHERAELSRPSTNLFPSDTQMCMTCVANGFRARLAKISGRILNVDELITVGARNGDGSSHRAHTHTHRI